MQDRTALYRHFAGDGSLLYVGISVSAMARLCQHVGGSSWAGDIARVGIEWFDTRRSALAAERNAIRTERPAHNVQHNWRGRGLNKQTVRTITDALGSAAIQERLGVTEFSIRHARREGSFAASWYAAMKAMCDEAGVDCPMSAFNWKTSEPASRSEASNAR